MPSNRKKVALRYLPLLALVGLFGTLLSWAIASPVGSSPDEDFHLVSIWCANGGSEDKCEGSGDSKTRLVSSALLKASCFARDPIASAECQVKKEIFTSPTMVESSRGNFAGAYPSGFYSFMHFFAGSDIQISVLVMRFVNVVLFCGLITTLWLFIPSLRQSLYFTTLLTMVPLGVFLIASINPSSWAIMAALTTFFATSGALTTSESRTHRLVLWSLSVFGLLLAAASRYDGLAYAGVSFIAAFVVAHRIKFTRKIIMWAASVASALFVIGLLVGGWKILPWLAAFAGDTGHGNDISPLNIFMNNVVSLPMLFAGFSGATGLGWLDTEMPLVTWMISATLLWASLFSRLAFANRRQVWAASGVAFLLIAIPLAVLQSQMATVGQNVQARYIFPLMIALVSVLMATHKQKSDGFFTTVQTSVICIGLFVAQFAAIFFNMSRYISIGKYPLSANLNASALDGWWWPVGPSPMAVLAIAAVSFGLFLSLALSYSRKQGSTSVPRMYEHDVFG